MGIQGLAKVVDEHASTAVQTKEIKAYFGRRIAIDASMSMYQFLIAVRQDGSQLTDENGETTSHLNGMFYRTIRMMENGIKPVFVFDGKPPDLKAGELDKRVERRADAEKHLTEAREKGDAIAIEKFERRLVKVTKEHTEDCKKLLRLMGVPVVEAPCEAEAQCAELVRSEKVYATATEDMDALTFGSNVLTRRMTFSEAKKLPIQEFNLDKILRGFDMTMEQFIDFCILLGCDYCPTIRGVGPKKAFDLIIQHKSIEAIIEHLDKEKYVVPEDWAFKAARQLFLEPDVTKGNTIELLWTEPKDGELIQFMCQEKGFSEDRIRSALERLKKSRKEATQGRIDGFFKTTAMVTPHVSAAAQVVVPSPMSMSADQHEVDKRDFGRPLPEHYGSIYHLFMSMENVVAVAFNRGSRITFDSVARNVVRNAKRSLTMDHLSQMLYVYPQAYKVSWEKRRQPRKDDIGSTSNYDLVLRPILVNDRSRTPTRVGLVSPVKLISPVKRRPERDFHRKSPTKAMVLPQPRPAVIDPSPKMNGRCLAERKMRFRHLLMLKVDEAYVEFLSKNQLSIMPGTDFHPEFDLNSCPPIACSPLPALPASATPLRSAQDYFRIVQQPPPAVAAAPEHENVLASVATPSENVSKTPKLTLLERIRAKEAAKKSVDFNKIHALEKRCDQLNMLNMTLLEVICSHFQLGKKRSMNLRQLSAHVQLACSHIKTNVFLELIDVLCESSGGNCTKETLRANTFLKIAEVRIDKLRVYIEDALERTQRELLALKGV